MFFPDMSGHRGIPPVPYIPEVFSYPDIESPFRFPYVFNIATTFTEIDHSHRFTVVEIPDYKSSTRVGAGKGGRFSDEGAKFAFPTSKHSFDVTLVEPARIWGGWVVVTMNQPVRKGASLSEGDGWLVGDVFCYIGVKGQEAPVFFKNLPDSI